MHRTDSIDLVVVIGGEGELAYPDEDGQVEGNPRQGGRFHRAERQLSRVAQPLRRALRGFDRLARG